MGFLLYVAWVLSHMRNLPLLCTIGELPTRRSKVLEAALFPNHFGAPKILVAPIHNHRPSSHADAPKKRLCNRLPHSSEVQLCPWIACSQLARVPKTPRNSIGSCKAVNLECRRHFWSPVSSTFSISKDPTRIASLPVLLLEILPGRLELSVKPRVPDSKAHGHTVYTSFWSLLLICRLGNSVV